MQAPRSGAMWSSWTATPVYGKPLVKRVIAKGGDTISIDYAAGTVYGER